MVGAGRCEHILRVATAARTGSMQCRRQVGVRRIIFFIFFQIRILYSSTSVKEQIIYQWILFDFSFDDCSESPASR